MDERNRYRKFRNQNNNGSNNNAIIILFVLGFGAYLFKKSKKK